MFLSCSHNTDADVNLSNEMSLLIKDLNNSKTSIGDDLSKYSDSTKVLNHSMCYYNLQEPEVISGDTKEYTVRFKSGVTIREYVFVWEEKKLVEIIDNGIVG